LRSQAARQGLAVLMAFAVVVLTHETSTLRQWHNCISIDFKFGVGDNVREVTRPAKFGLGPMSDQAATWGQHIRVLAVTFLVFYFFNRATANTGESIFAHNSSKDAFRCKEDSFGNKKCVVVTFGGVLP